MSDPIESPTPPFVDLDEALAAASSALRPHATEPYGDVALSPARAAIIVLNVAAPLLVAAGRARAAADIRAHPGPDPSPASPTWWAGYTEALSDCARLAAGAEGGGEADHPNALSDTPRVWWYHDPCRWASGPEDPITPRWWTNCPGCGSGEGDWLQLAPVPNPPCGLRTGGDRCSYCRTKDRDECPGGHA